MPSPPIMDHEVFTVLQTRRAIFTVLTQNGNADDSRADVIYRQIAPKEADGSVKVPVLRQMLVLKAKQIMFNKSLLPNPTVESNK